MSTLTLNITNLDALQHGVLCRHQFDRNGGTIGSQGADWLIEDRERRIAPIHYEIRWLEGTFCAIDRCNQGSPSLGENAPVRLHEGDQLSIGGYRLQVHYDSDRLDEPALESLFTSTRQALNALTAEAASEPLVTPQACAPRDIRDAFAKGFGHDPLAALDAHHLLARDLP